MGEFIEKLLLMPIHDKTRTTITPSFKWEIYKYVQVWNGEDYDIEDECNDVTVTLNVPRISFMEYIDTFLFYKGKDWYNNHYVSRKIAPLDFVPNRFWFYFDSKNGNFLFNNRENNRIIAIYYIEEFSQYAIIDLDMQKKH